MKVNERTLFFDKERKIREFELSTQQIKIVVHDFGARIHQIFTRDKNDEFENILLSRDEPETYRSDKGYYGLICGPVAGRIGQAKWDDIQLEPNENGNLLHSGKNSWSGQFWDVELLEDAIKLNLTDEDSGFPGPIHAEVIYRLEGANLSVEMSARSEADSLFNPAFHPYFNLTADKESIEKHLIQASVRRLVETDSENIPTGHLIDTENTVYDLSKTKSIKQILQEKPEGFDNCLVFDQNQPAKLTLVDEQSGRRMTCQTDRKAVVVYTATHPEQESSVNGSKMTANRGIAIEFQELPDAINHEDFGSIRLVKGENKRFKTIYSFDRI